MRKTHILLSIGLFTTLVTLPGCALPWSSKQATDEELAAIVQKRNDSSIYSQIQKSTAQLEEVDDQVQLQDSLLKQINQRVNSSYVYPIEDYTNQKTKKVFGQYISPESSPTPNEKFTGYHTGDDIEVSDINQTVSVYAAASGTVVAKKTITGYGGVVILEFTDPTTSVVYHALYGHLDLDTVALAVGDAVTAGQKVAELGADASEDTDGERKHLHFGLYPYDGTEYYAGYVEKPTDLSLWQDPSTFFSEHSAAEPNTTASNTATDGEPIDVSPDIDSVVGAALQKVEQ